MKILIVDDSSKWVMWHESAVRELLGNDVEIDKAFSAAQGVEKLTASIDLPYDIIFTDMQMEPDFLPLYAGEWLKNMILNIFRNTNVTTLKNIDINYHFYNKQTQNILFYIYIIICT